MPTAFHKICMAGNQNQSSLEKDEPSTLNRKQSILKYLLLCATHEKSVQAQAALAHPLGVTASPARWPSHPGLNYLNLCKPASPASWPCRYEWHQLATVHCWCMHLPLSALCNFLPDLWTMCGAGNKSNKTSLIRKKTDPREKYFWPMQTTMFWNEAFTEKGQRKSPAMENSLWCIFVCSCKHEPGALRAFTAGLHHNSRPYGSQSLKKMSPRSPVSPLADHE